ncbi:MAG TPA: superoxide dismutase family protein [Acidimicrobiales bacterium]|nr:superoxide dismutase family protein [Acidimicrobiales bacterium]
MTKRGAAAAAFMAAAAVGVGIVVTGPASGAVVPQARATLVNTAGDVVGEVVFKGHGSHANLVEVDVTAPAAPGLGAFHGFHVHTVGNCNPTPSGSSNVPFGSAGGHWNPGAATHGAHAGDMPSLLFTADGTAHATFETDRFDVDSLLDAGGDGAAVILHAGADNFANVPPAYGAANATTLATGDAGPRYACGVITEP